MRIHGYRDAPKVEDAPPPDIGADEVLVRVEAAALNPLDAALHAGALERFFPLAFPYTMGTDLAGTVEQVGARVSAWRPGDRVIGRPQPTNGGAFAEFAAVPGALLVAAPPALPILQAAGLPTAGGTAWRALFDHARLQAGQTVLIHAGAGGVGSFAVQFAHAAHARVLATASGDGVEVVRELGADEVIDYKAQDFTSVVRDVDVVLDTLGGETRERSFEVLRRGGHLVSTVLPLAEEAAKARGVSASVVSLTREGVPLREIAQAFRDHGLRTLIDRAFPLAQIADALARQASRRARGKIVLTLRAGTS